MSLASASDRNTCGYRGSPIDILADMKGEFTDSLMTSLAGNMCTAPVLLAVLCVAIASPSWKVTGFIPDLDSEPDEIIQPPRPPPKGFFDISFGPPVPVSEMT